MVVVKILFLGNHTVGAKALEAISETEEVVGVVAHPPDPEDGVRYQSVFDLARQRGWELIRSAVKNGYLEAFIRATTPDLLWITDYRYLLPWSVISSTPLGAINLHPSLLPKYRGRAPLNWAILHGERTLGLTAHWVDQGMDTGDIIEQVSFELREDQDVGEALKKLYPLYTGMTRRVLGYLQSGRVPRRAQDHSKATIFPRRRPADGLIDFSQTATQVHNLIRAVARPYPGAFAFLEGNKVIIWKSRLAAPNARGRPAPGSIVAWDEEGPLVQCGLGIIQFLEMEGSWPACPGKPGRVFRGK
jgi:methionyl-tRNA formyltransferase